MSSNDKQEYAQRWGIFPPWGVMNSEDIAVALATPRRPLAWQGDENSYVQWFDRTLSIIQELIWPVFDASSRSWRGGAVQSMRKLTETDLELLSIIRCRNPLIFESLVYPTAERTHHQFFGEEDESVKPWMSAHREYDPACTQAEIDTFQQIIRIAYSTNVGGSVLNFKYLLQRPRPLQMAMILKGNKDFDHYEALSADTPSICHGHCAQGLLLIGAVMEFVILSGMTFDDDRWAALEQFAVDVGDRRVMARVHYPSDSVCSWLIVLGMANSIFKTAKVKRRLWQAISQRSYVYRLITESKNHKKSFAAALKAVEKEANA